MASSEKPMAHQNYQQQQVLKCPRCDSSNTKFCYYNNYSLSQPRHFCKACKRYWTRGGTLRNVPVGGGCRKINKRSIKTTTKTTTYTTLVDHTPNPNPNSNSRSDHSTPSNSHNNLNPLYGLLQENHKYPRFNARVSDTRGLNVSRYDLAQPKMNSVGLEFSSADHGHNSVSLVSSYPSIFGGEFTSSSSSNSDHTLSSILSSRLHQQPTLLMSFSPYGDGVGSVVNELQMEGPKSSMDWNNSLNIGQSQNDQTKALRSFDPTSLLWTISGGDGKVEDWGDPTSNISIPSLI